MRIHLASIINIIIISIIIIVVYHLEEFEKNLDDWRCILRVYFLSPLPDGADWCSVFQWVSLLRYRTQSASPTAMHNYYYINEYSYCMLAAFNNNTFGLVPPIGHACVWVHIYIYICVCVCVCVCDLRQNTCRVYGISLIPVRHLGTRNINSKPFCIHTVGDRARVGLTCRPNSCPADKKTGILMDARSAQWVCTGLWAERTVIHARSAKIVIYIVVWRTCA